jgi:hypothetical protein
MSELEKLKKEYTEKIQKFKKQEEFCNKHQKNKDIHKWLEILLTTSYGIGDIFVAIVREGHIFTQKEIEEGFND